MLIESENQNKVAFLLRNIVTRMYICFIYGLDAKVRNSKVRHTFYFYIIVHEINKYFN